MIHALVSYIDMFGIEQGHTSPYQNPKPYQLDEPSAKEQVPLERLKHEAQWENRHLTLSGQEPKFEAQLEIQHKHT